MARFWQLAVLAVGALATKVTPMEKVVSLLEKLEAQVTAEGKKEAKAYDDFACYCKDQLVEKSGDIAALKKSVKLEQMHNTTASANLATAEDEMNKAKSAMDKAEDEIEKNTNNMNETFEADEANIKSLKRGVDALKGAIETIRSGRDAQGGTGPLKSDVFAQLPKEVLAQIDQPKRTSKFGSKHILELLKDVLDNFETQLREAVAAQKAARSDSLDMITMGNNELKDQTAAFNKARADAADAAEHQADAEAELDRLNGDLKRQQAFLGDLQDQCKGKAEQWDERSKGRADELEALNKAIKILKERAVDVAGAITNTARGGFLAKRTKVHHHDAMIEEPMPEVDELVALESFVQLKTASPATEALRFLSEQARKMGGSVALSTLVMKATADPFRAVKKMINKLITDLKSELEEAQEKASDCKSDMEDAQNTIDKSTAEVTENNGIIADANKTIKENKAFKANSESMLKEALAAKAEQTKLHKEFMAQSTDTRDQAKQGKLAVQDALEVLNKLYGTGFIQQPDVRNKDNWNANADKDGATTDADAQTGFSSGDARSQEEAGGIIGILEVLQSDFARTQDEMEQAMAKAESENAKMQSEFDKTIDKENDNIKEFSAKIADATASKDDATTALDTAQKTLDAGNKVLAGVEKECVQGESYEVRMQKRENEIASLKQALEILDSADVNMTRKGQSLD